MKVCSECAGDQNELCVCVCVCITGWSVIEWILKLVSLRECCVVNVGSVTQMRRVEQI